MRDPGAPVDLYRLLAAADEPELIDREIPDNAEILELGAGSGRITHPLIALGRRVVAVDFNPEMLELIEGAETVLARIEDLELGRTFGGVLLMSTLIDAPEEIRLSLLRSIRRHLAPHGVALIERPDADRTPSRCCDHSGIGHRAPGPSHLSDHRLRRRRARELAHSHRRPLRRERRRDARRPRGDGPAAPAMDRRTPPLAR